MRWLLLLLLLHPVLAGAQQTPRVAVADTPIATVFDWQAEHCSEWDIPDAPLRAFRTADGTVVAFASSHDNHPFAGPALARIKHTCHTSLPSNPDPDPARYDGLRYVTATWTTDGTHVTALIHNEYHAERFQNCKYPASMQCWYNTILAASSADRGQTFTLGNPPRVVAAIPFTQAVEQGRHRGFFNPSNILFHDGFWYMAAHTTGGAGQQPGTCLFRSANVDDPAAWRSFDGQDFTTPPIDPYRDDVTRYVPCRPMTGIGTLSSISYYSPRGLYLAVFPETDRDHPRGSIAYAWSNDMLHWGPHTTLLDRPAMNSKDCSDTERYFYPSVLDPQAPGRNFDTIGNTPSLFLTRLHVKDCKLSPNRDLVRLQLRIDPNPLDTARR